MESQCNSKPTKIPICEIPVEVLVSLATSPTLILLIATNAMGSLVREFSQRSEELFHGDRLPNVSFPYPPRIEK